ncbi:class I adenylate-forming enzyme family protein [Hyphomonas johnsonii]|uniref:AMP-dependent synthetase/ligase n=1 Tax=Hyphomonas johnsonii MHS-2 TaxID=1280950 RepID=A0A059FN79_9PROT|nr:class I adenylate-forming enzyme family protein [Hyphomonas johnsonii]KCZ92135.1 AMP-dependent synthetase/ligase [Hyphomonas johnsonii MHS-2]
MNWPVCSIAEARAALTKTGAPFETRDEKIGDDVLRTYVHAPSHIRQVLDDSRRFADRDFLVYEGDRVTFEAHWRAANAFGRALAERYGIEKGDRVAVAMRNFPEWPACAFGALAIGAILVPLNAWETGAGLARMIRDSGAKVTVVDSERLERLQGEEHGSTLITVRDGGGDDRFERLVGPVAEWSMLPDRPAPDRTLAPDDLATIGFTSGTTGAAKGALGTHRGAMTNLVSTQYRAARAALRRGDSWPPAAAKEQLVVLLPLPFFHATGMHSGLVPALARGTRLVGMHRWDLEKALALIEAERANILVLVPTLVEQLLQHVPDGGMEGLESVHTVTYGGAPASADLAAGVQSRFPGASPAQGYGATEVTSLIASNSHEDLIARPDSVGTVVPCCDIRIVDDHGNDVATGAPGELWVRGPNVFRGYWELEDATSAVKQGAWYRTGDIVTMDEEGFIFVKDRKKDMVIRGGENIYCAEVEQAIGRISGVVECAVFGLPDKIMGEIVAATVVAHTQAGLTAQGVRDRLAADLAAFKVPTVVSVVDAPLPRNAAGKVLKHKLRDEMQVEQA